jgi:hypothetical protein
MGIELDEQKCWWGPKFVAAIEPMLGKKIASATLVNDELDLVFEGGGTLRLFDSGQDCCEFRYMRTDDDLPYFTGAELRGVELLEAPDAPGDEVHEVQFLVVHTTKGDLTMSSHNEHNGYYGGFDITAQVIA